MLRALEALERQPRLKLLILAAIAIVLAFVPILNIVLNWFETFFHELSHGLVALATGGRIISIELNWDGSGLIRYAGSMAPVLVTFFGYPGAVLCGVGLYLAALSQSKAAHTMALALAGLIGLTALFWMRDPVSLLIALIMIAVLGALWRWSGHFAARLALELIGVYLMIGGIQSIWSMMGFRGRGDAQLLAEMTWLPAFLFPMIWLAIGLWALWWLWRREETRGTSAKAR